MSSQLGRASRGIFPIGRASLGISSAQAPSQNYLLERLSILRLAPGLGHRLKQTRFEMFTYGRAFSMNFRLYGRAIASDFNSFVRCSNLTARYNVT
jgi:hypothetical protein